MIFHCHVSFSVKNMRPKIAIQSFNPYRKSRMFHHTKCCIVPSPTPTLSQLNMVVISKFTSKFRSIFRGQILLLVSGRVLASKHPLRPYISNLHSPSGQAVEFDIALDDRGHWELNTDSAYFCWPVTVCVCVCFFFFRWFVGWELCFNGLFVYLWGRIFWESPKKRPKTLGLLVGLNHTKCETYTPKRHKSSKKESNQKVTSYWPDCVEGFWGPKNPILSRFVTYHEDPFCPLLVKSLRKHERR